MTVRGKWGTLLAAALLSLFVAIPIAYAHEWAYADSFPVQSYNNSSGTLPWSGPWQEIGESDGPTAGVISVSGSGCSGNCLVLEASGLLPPLLADISIRRTADLSQASAAELYFKMERQPGSVPLGSLRIQIRKVGQGSFDTLKSYSLSQGDNNPIYVTLPEVTGYVGSVVEVQFVIRRLSADTKVLIDDVELGIEYPAATTTTTSSTTTTTTTMPAPTTTTTTKPTSTTTPTSSTTTTTLARSASSTTTTTLPETTTTTGGDTGSDDLPGPLSGQSQPPTDSGALAAGETGSLAADIATARAFGISLNMAPIGNNRYDRMLGLNPLTSLTASFRSVVEAIQNEYLSALGLAFLVAFFAVRLPSTDEDENPVP